MRVNPAESGYMKPTQKLIIIMEKDILIQNLKEKLGNDTASVISDRTFDGISSLYLDSFKEDEKVTDDTYAPVLAVLKEFAGQKRFDEKAFTEKYKAEYEKQHEKEVSDKVTLAVAKAIEEYKKEHPEPNPKDKDKDKDKDSDKDLDAKIADAVAKAIGGLTAEDGAIGKLTGTVNSFISNYNEREKNARDESVRQQLREYLEGRKANGQAVIDLVVDRIQIGEKPNLAELKVLAERDYEASYKKFYGEGAPAFGGNGNGGGTGGDTSFVKERIEALKKEAEESAGYQAEMEKNFQ